MHSACTPRALMRSVACAGRLLVATPPTSPTLSQHQTAEPCRDRLQSSTEAPLSRHQIIPCCPYPVAALKPLSRDSRHRASHLCRDRAPKEACRDRPSHSRACVGPRLCAQARLPCTLQSLLSRPHCSVATQDWKWAVAHPILIPCTLFFVQHILNSI